MIAKQGFNDFNARYGATFTNASEDQQAALLTTFFKQGEFLILSKPGSFNGTNAGEGSGGQMVLDNFETIKNIVNADAAVPRTPAEVIAAGFSEFDAVIAAENGGGWVSEAKNWTGTELWSSQINLFDLYDVLQFQDQIQRAGGNLIKFYDTQNTHPYGELEISKNSTGKVTSAKPKIDGQPSGSTIDFSVVGQVLGSALGRALAPDNQFGQIAIGTVAGAIGQKLAQAFTASLLTNATSVNLSSAFANFDISLAGAGAGSVASFLTAELGHALGLEGFKEQLFNATIGSVASGVANKVATEMLYNHLSFSAAIGTIEFGSAAINAAYSISGLLGTYLGHELAPAETYAGAVGGQLLGAVGSAIGISAALSGALGAVLGFIAPGIGSLIGTVLGTLIGDLLGSHPHPAAVDLIDQAGTLYGYTHSQVSASDGGDWSIPDQMAPAAVAIINTYLGAVKGAALDHSKQIQVGYVTDPDFRYISGWGPTHKYLSFVHADDAVHAAALDALQHLEVIGGNLLLKRAHANSQASIPDPEPEWAGLITPSSESGAAKLLTMSADLAVAQDYENYLNNREAINALIAAYPDKAFAAGWIATFARVNDLGLNQYGPNDFLGGLVGYLDSVGKAGLVFDAAGVSVKQRGDGSIAVEIRVPNGTYVPGSLSVFSGHTSETSDATGKTVQFIFAGGLAAGGFHGPDSAETAVSGNWLVKGGAGNNLWFGGDDVYNEYHDNQTAASHDILIGGAGGDAIFAGNGWDFIDSGSGDDYIFAEDGSDILRGGRGGDLLYGGAGNDTYGFNRGDGVDRVSDDHSGSVFVPDVYGTPGSGHYEVQQLDAGADRLAFGPGIAVSDIALTLTGNDMIIAIKDPAYPGVAFWDLTDRITLQNWANPLDAIETLVFADGTTLDIGAALGSYLKPFGATLSRSSVAENSAIGTAVGTVTAFDLNAAAVLSYSLIGETYGRFAINASSGQITVTGALNFEGTPAWPLMVRAADQYGNVYDKPFVITVTNVNEAPAGITLSGGSVAENSPGGTIAATAAGSDEDAGTVFSYSLRDDAGGRFAINQSGQIAVVSSALINYEGTPAWPIVVRAADQYGQVYDKSFIIDVTNVNEAPANASLSGGVVVENAPAGAYVATVAGIDPDANTTFSYSLRDPDGRFAINAQTGVVTVLYGALIDYEAAASWPITVRIADQYGLFFDKSFAIAVTDANDAPTDATLFGGTVREHSPNGTRVGTVIGADPDAGEVLRYALLTDAGGRFAINASTGVITVKDGTRLDYATAQSHTLMVQTIDQLGLVYERPLTVAVAAGPINDLASGTSTVTTYDGADAYGWHSFTSTYNGLNGHGSLKSQLGINDGGSTWKNVFDVAHAYSWNFYIETSGPNGNVLTRAVTWDDGTHSLLVNDPANASWSSFTLNYGANWTTAPSPMSHSTMPTVRRSTPATPLRRSTPSPGTQIPMRLAPRHPSCCRTSTATARPTCCWQTMSRAASISAR